METEQSPRLPGLQDQEHGLRRFRWLGTLLRLGPAKHGGDTVSGSNDATANNGDSARRINGSTPTASTPTDTVHWQNLKGIIDTAVRSEVQAAERTAKHIDEGSDYPGYTVGPEKMPTPGSTDWREMAPANSDARKQAEAQPQTPKEFRVALDDAAALRPSIDHPSQ